MILIKNKKEEKNPYLELIKNNHHSYNPSTENKEKNKFNLELIHNLYKVW